jgi:hypothetical protein
MSQQPSFATRRSLRPGSFALIRAMILNGIFSFLFLRIALAMFGIEEIIPEAAARMGHSEMSVHWYIAATLTPGAAVCFGMLWFWLILTGRTERGISWGSAVVYGVFIGLFDVPFAFMIEGFRLGFGFLGLLLGLVIVFLIPSLTVCMSHFGITFGLANGASASRWIQEKYLK